MSHEQTRVHPRRLLVPTTTQSPDEQFRAKGTNLQRNNANSWHHFIQCNGTITTWSKDNNETVQAVDTILFVATATKAADITSFNAAATKIHATATTRIHSSQRYFVGHNSKATATTIVGNRSANNSTGHEDNKAVGITLKLLDARSAAATTTKCKRQRNSNNNPRQMQRQQLNWTGR